MLTAEQSCAVVRLNGLNHSKPGLPVIKLFVAAGAILPLILVSLENSISYPFRVLLWPSSILTAGMQCSYFTLTCFNSALLNIPFYLALGCLVWLGLQRPRSIAYLTFVGIVYLTVVGAAEFYEWLLT